MYGMMRVKVPIQVVVGALLVTAAFACRLSDEIASQEISPTAADAQLAERVSSPTPPATPSPTSPATASPPPAGTASPAPEPSSGIFGEVTIGPTCPVLRQDSSCDARPFQAEIVIEDPDSRQAFATIRTDGEGRFQFDLPPGDYYVQPVDPSPGLPPFAKGFGVTVMPDQFTHVSIQYDSGIRFRIDLRP